MTISLWALPSRDNKPWQGKHSPLSLPCLRPPLPSEQTALPLEATWQREGRPGLSTSSRSALLFLPVVNKGLARTTHCRCFYFPAAEVMCTFTLLSFPDLPPITRLSGPLQYNVNTVRGEASARFYTIQPTPTLRRPAFSISYGTVAHKYARTYTGKSTLNTHSSHACNHVHTHTDRRGGELMHCHPQQQDCEHSRNKYPVLVIKFSSRASSLVGPSAFPGEKYTHLTLSWSFYHNASALSDSCWTLLTGIPSAREPRSGQGNWGGDEGQSGGAEKSLASDLVTTRHVLLEGHWYDTSCQDKQSQPSQRFISWLLGDTRPWHTVYTSMCCSSLMSSADSMHASFLSFVCAAHLVWLFKCLHDRRTTRDTDPSINIAWPASPDGVA